MAIHIMNIIRTPFTRRTVGRLPWASLLLTLSAILVHLFTGLRLSLIFERSALENVELWRLLTCHWVHLNWDHLLWSGLTFLVLGSICEIIDKKKTYATLTIAGVLIPAGLWWGQPDLVVYGGLSGLDCALYGLLLTLLIKQEFTSGNWIWIIFYSMGLLALPAKVGYEMITGQTIFVSNSHTDMIPVPLSHLIGGLAGFFVGLYSPRKIPQTASTFP